MNYRTYKTVIDALNALEDQSGRIYRFISDDASIVAVVPSDMKVEDAVRAWVRPWGEGQELTLVSVAYWAVGLSSEGQEVYEDGDEIEVEVGS
jgi:hypothetical protein